MGGQGSDRFFQFRDLARRWRQCLNRAPGETAPSGWVMALPDTRHSPPDPFEGGAWSPLV